MKSLLPVLCLITCAAFGQKLTSNGFKHYTVTSAETGTVNFYVKGDGADKPLLLYLDGSGAYPLFQKMKQGMASTVILNLKKVTEKYCVVLISKPGVAFIDSTHTEASFGSQPEEPELYRKTLSMDWRATSASMAIDYVLKNKLANAQQVAVLGFSEGAQVAPAVAVKNKKVTHLLCFGGNGLNHLFDPIIQTRMKMYAGQYTPEQAQHKIDSLMNDYKDIYTHPQSTDMQWWGHSYKRWSSFDSHTPVENLLTLNIPIYLVNGGLDENPVLSTDFVQLAFIRAGKSNLTRKVYPNYDHQLNEHVRQNGQEVQVVPRYKEVMDEAFAWLGSR